MNKEIVWMDYARFIGIFLVVFGHTMQRFPLFGENPFYQDMWNLIYLFHMPLFFVISGFLYKPINNYFNEFNNIKMEGGKILYSLIIPYLIYQVLYLPLVLIQYRTELYEPNIFLKLMGGILMGDGYKTPYSLPVNLPCWFLVSIIQLRLFFMFIPINRITSGLLVIGSFFFLYLRKQYGWDLYFCLDSTIMAIPYFIAGYYFAKTTIIKRTKKYRVLSVLLCMMLLCFILHYNGPAQMNGPSCGKSILWNYIAGLSGTLIIFLLSQQIADKVGKRHYVRVISRNTLFIIFSHWVLLSSCRIITYKLPENLTANLFVTFLMVMLVSIGVLYVSKLVIEHYINKYPVLFGKQKT